MKSRSVWITNLSFKREILSRMQNIMENASSKYCSVHGDHYSSESHNRVKTLSLIMEYLPTNLDECINKCNEEKFTIADFGVSKLMSPLKSSRSSLYNAA